MFNVLNWLKGQSGCPNKPPTKQDERREGKCHVCKSNPVSIGFCPVCCHWFCPSCKISSDRVLAAIRHKFGPPKDGCCGPIGGVEGVR